MSFPLTYLPQELSLEILRLAALPSLDHKNAAGTVPQVNMYKGAVTLALVSSDFRETAMPCLLHSVILRTQERAHRFVRTLELQEYFKQTESRLQLDYKRYIRRLWSSEYSAPLAEGPVKEFENSNLLYNLFRDAKVLGFTSNSHHLLYEILGGIYAQTLPNWTCSNIIFGGPPLWNFLTSTITGPLFLGQLTHLTIWNIPDSQSSLIPSWIQMVPFSFMPNLQHFAFSINRYSAEGLHVLSYSLPTDGEVPTIFHKWASGPDPLSCGSLSYQTIGFCTTTRSRKGDMFELNSGIWETCFLLGENA